MRIGLSCLLLAGCAIPTEVGSVEQAQIYGEIDFLDVYAHPDLELQRIARRSVGGVVDRRLVSDGSLRTLPLADALEAQFGIPYCDEEPFADEPVLMNCSGALIDDDLFITAAHCIPTQDYCDQYAIVFDYYRSAPGTMEIVGTEDIYFCDEIVQISYLRDHAIVRLDRNVSAPHEPVFVRRGSDDLDSGDRLSIIGHPLGLPMRIDDSASAVALYSDGVESFLFKGDVLFGSSGSPIFTSAGEIVGLVSRGDGDVNLRDCVRLLVEDDALEPGTEVAGYVYRALNDLCKGGGGSTRLCADPDIWCPNCKGSGGCSAGNTGTSGSSEMWLVLPALFFIRRRR